MVSNIPDPDSTLERLNLGVYGEDLPELIARLGNFATGHYLEINGIAVASDTPEASIIEATKFNPDLITWFSDPNDKAIKVAVVTKDNITNFARNKGINLGYGELIINKLVQASKPSKSKKDKADFIRGFIFYANSDSRADSTFAAGIKADRLKELVSVIKDTNTKIYRLGDQSIDALSDLADELYAPSN